jgi:S1-C subfamily serine protease
LRRVRCAALGAGLALAAGLASGAGAATAQAPSTEESQTLSSTAQAAYARAADKLVQVRILLMPARTQTAAGSGFYVSADGVVATNYHVIAKAVFEGRRHTIEVQSPRGTPQPATLLAFDTRHDLALLKVERPAGATLLLADTERTPLRQGQRLFALGNPLDLGFAIAEGTYNGFIERHFYRQLFFAGALNPGMSGGPAIDESGRVVGVNVAKRLDGELVSFLVPVERLHELLRSAGGTSAEAPAAQVTRQLLEHQQRVAARLLSAPLPTKALGTYQVPVAPGDWIRCRGSTTRGEEAYVRVDTTRCSSESAVYVHDSLRLGGVRYDHDYGTSDSSLRFLRRHTEGFAREPVGPLRGNDEFGPARCNESFVAHGGSRLRVVLCASALRKHPGLYNFVVLAASVDESKAGLQSRLDARGFSYDNGVRIARHFLDGIRWNSPQTTPPKAAAAILPSS